MASTDTNKTTDTHKTDVQKITAHKTIANKTQVDQTAATNTPSNRGQSVEVDPEIDPLEHFYVMSEGDRVAEGVILPAGAFALSWFGEMHSHGTYPDLETFRRIQARMSGREIVATPAPKGKTFYLQRNEDWNGISGTGKVAVGYEFEQIAVLQWLGPKGSTFWYESVDKVEWVHGHGGRTVVVRVNK